MTMNTERKVIELEQGWTFMQKGITKLKNLLEGLPEQQFNSEEYIMLYTYPFSAHAFGLIRTEGGKGEMSNLLRFSEFLVYLPYSTHSFIFLCFAVP